MKRILFPLEKKRIKKEFSEVIRKEYNEEIKKFKFTHINEKMIYLYVYLENEEILYITANKEKIEETMTICDDMSL